MSGKKKLKMKNEELKTGKQRWFRLLVCVSLILNSQFLIFNSASAQVKWHTIEEAATAKIGERLYFVDFYTSWCGFCKEMDRKTFRDPTVAKLLNRYYYPVKFNAESNVTFQWKGQTYRPGKGGIRPQHDFARGLQGYPTFVLFKADGSVVQVIPGFYKAEDFIVILWYFASGDCERYPYERYRRIFDKEIRPTMDKALKQDVSKSLNTK